MSYSDRIETLSPQLSHDANLIMKRYHTDDNHCKRVQAHAKTIMAWALPTFKLPTSEISYLYTTLQLAALLHDIGHFVQDAGHHRHSRYLIRHDRQTAGWSDKLRADVATLAFTHRKVARLNWLTDLFGGEPHLMQLSAILRVADGLDHLHQGGTHLLSAQSTAHAFVLQVSGIQPTTVRHILTHKADLWPLAFSQSFDLKN